MIENIKIEAKMEIKKISGLSCQDFIRNILDIEERAELNTDFPEGTLKMYYIDNVLLLPSEY